VLFYTRPPFFSAFLLSLFLFALFLVTGVSDLKAQNNLLVNGITNITNSVNYDNTYVGLASNTSMSILNITGVGVVLSNTSNFFCGYGPAASNNATIISNGASVIAQTFNIGCSDYFNTASNNSILINGSNSFLQSTGGIIIGNSGSGTLTVANSGCASNGGSSIVIASNTGSRGVINIGSIDGSDAAGTIIGDITFGNGTPTLNFNQTNAITFNNAISGGTNAEVNFLNGTTTLSNHNTYTGSNLVISGTVITAVAEALGATNNLLTLSNRGSMTGTVNLNMTTQSVGVLSMNGGTLTNGTLNSTNIQITEGSNNISANLNNTGSVSFLISGGNNTLSGNISNGTNFYNITGGMNLFSGVLSGSGGANFSGGTTILNNSNTYTGPNTITHGTLIAANASAFGESSVYLGGGSRLARLSMESNIVNLNIASLSWASNSLISIRLGSQVVNVSGSIDNADSSPKNLLFINSSLDNSSNTFMTFASQSGFTTNSFYVAGISGYSFILTATNFSAFLGTNTDLIIATNKEINTSFTSASLTVVRNGILSGTGVYTGNLTNNWLLMPGDPIGTFTVNGNVTLNPRSTLQINVVSPTDYGSLQVNGSVDLAGTLEVAPLASKPLTYGEQLTFINSTGPIKGTFQSIKIDQSYCRGRVTIIGDPQATITIAPTSYTYVAQNQNQTNVALALNSFISATSGDALVVSTDLDSLSADQYPGAFNAIMPTLYQSLSTIAFNIDNAQNQEMIQRLWGIRLANASEQGGHFSMSGLAENTPLLAGEENKNVQDDILRPAPNKHWGIFVDGNGIFAKANSANLLPTYNAQSGGVTTGLSYAWNTCFTTGLYTGYEGVYSKYSGGSTLVDNQVNFGLFGTYGQKEGKGLFIDGLIGGAYDNYQMNRNISFGSGDNALNRTAMGTPGAGELNTMVATGYDMKRGHFTFGPLSSLQYQYFGTSPFTESGADSLNLAANAWNTSSMIFSLGSHLAYNWQVTKNLLVIPQVSLNWQHQFLENPYTINSTLNSGSSPSFANTSSAPLRDTLYTGLGFTIEMGKRWESSFFYNAAAGNQDVVSQNIFWSLGCKF